MIQVISKISEVIPSIECHKPSVQRYVATKREYPNHMVFVEVGDFYETFFQDAQRASEALELILIKTKSNEVRVLSAGVPAHAINRYVLQLREKGIDVLLKPFGAT